MNLISSNCIVGQIFKKLNLPYNTPFVWNSIKLSDFIKLIKNFHFIDLKNIEFEFEKGAFGRYPLCSKMILDNNISIYFSHHIKDCSKTIPFKKNSDLYYYNILEYLKEKWLKRSELIPKENPIFIYDDLNTSPSWKYTDTDIQNFLSINDYKKLLITSNHSLKKFENDKLKVMIKEKDVIDTSILAERIIKNKELCNFLEIKIP